MMTMRSHRCVVWVVACLSYGCPSTRDTGRDAAAPADSMTRAQDDAAVAVARNDAGMVGATGATGALPADPCGVSAPKTCTDSSLRYADVAPIFAMRCGDTCHAVGNPDGNWPLVSYQHVADWSNEIRDQVASCSQPPPAARVPMSVAEREKILVWLRCGAPR
jgi:hypothetical protein